VPYALSLQEYALPEWFREPPPEWDRRLRDISPITDTLAHLRFRWREAREWWLDPHHGMWELYACTPKHMVGPLRAEQFELHWSELPTDRQEGRKAVVTNYQHFMWHSLGVEARRFLVLQGPGGGTVAQYTRREKRLLDAEGLLSEEFPLGMFEPCPFDERAVSMVQSRDRLLDAGGDLDRLEAMDRPLALRAADELAEQDYRRAYLADWYKRMAPCADFMKWFLQRKEAVRELPDAPEGLGNQVAQWNDQFIEHGTMPGGRTASTHRAHILTH
jgi:hypothetical protein